MRIQLEAQQKATDQLIANTKVLEGKLAEAKSKKDTLKARAASAKTSKQVQEMMGSLNTSNAVVAFDKMEEKVRGLLWGGGVRVQHEVWGWAGGGHDDRQGARR
jgi:phage shock protein A